MAIKKSELYSTLWKSCDELRGGMDASQYKDYVLVLLFVKYVSDKYAGQKDALIDVPRDGSFAAMVALKGDKEIGDKINKIIGKLAAANELKGVIDVADFNDADKLGRGKEMVDRLSALVGIFENLNFSRNRADGDDLLGDAYEYLMRHFATESGKSKGQFYTPAEVSRIMAKVIGAGSAKRRDQTIHDPTCGSGSLLLKAHDEARSATGLDLALYGQENDNATAALARMNMILHDCPSAEIWKDNTLSSPYFKQSSRQLKTFDFVVANPPFSSKAWSNGFDPGNDLYGRFPYGLPPKRNGDYAFLLHVLACLKSTGKGAIILPHGVLFRGNAEASIRREIVRRGYIKGIIGLPPNLSFGTGIPACIVVLDKENAGSRKGIFMIDASRGFMKDGNKNRLRAQDIHKIVDAFTRQLELPRYSRMVPLAEISDPKNDFNLNLPRYIDSAEPEDIQDIDGHLRGGIPDRDIEALTAYWQVLPTVRKALIAATDRKGYTRLRVPPTAITATICSNHEFTALISKVETRFAKWRKVHLLQLQSLSSRTKPSSLISVLSEEILTAFRGASLIDAYRVYQHLMSYWEETMRDDVHLILEEGWKGAAKPRQLPDNGGNLKERPDFSVGRLKFKADLIPVSLLVARYFPEERTELARLQESLADATAAIHEMAEEYGGGDGPLESVVDDSGKISRSAVKTRLAETEGDSDAEEERALLSACLALIEKQAHANIRETERALDAKVAIKYGKLSVDDIKTLVVEDKWIAAAAAGVQTELDRVSRALTGRIQLLADRYATPLPKLTSDMIDLTGKVEQHLRKMGAVWK